MNTIYQEFTFNKLLYLLNYLYCIPFLTMFVLIAVLRVLPRFWSAQCVGTDATHAEHIETIKSRNYVGVQGDGCFVPGELGMGLVEGGANVFLTMFTP